MVIDEYLLELEIFFKNQVKGLSDEEKITIIKSIVIEKFFDNKKLS